MERRKLLQSIAAGSVAAAVSGCIGGLGGGNGGNNSSEKSSGNGTGGDTTVSEEGKDVFGNITYQNDNFEIEFKSAKNVAGVNLVDEEGSVMTGESLGTGGSKLSVRHTETPNQNITFVAVNKQDEVISKVTKKFAAKLEFSDLRQPALDNEDAGRPGEGRNSLGMNPYSTLIVDVKNTGNVPFKATGISVTAGVPSPGSVSRNGSAFTVNPGQKKTVKADDSGNSTIAAWGGSWGADGAPEGACQGHSKTAKLAVIGDNGQEITRKMKIVYRGGLYVMNEMQNFSTCGRIHSVGYRPKRPDLNKETTEEGTIRSDDDD